MKKTNTKMKTKLTTMLFDMDGTLTDARKEITPEVVKSLTEIPNGTVKHLVTGSDMSKIEEQIPPSILLELFDRVYACNGTRVYNCKLDMDDESLPVEPELIHKVTLLDHYSESDINHIMNTLLQTAAKTHTKIKTGTFVEWRESQINFSVVGRNCTSEQREDYVKWDNKSGERNMCDHMHTSYEFLRLNHLGCFAYSKCMHFANKKVAIVGCGPRKWDETARRKL